MRWLSIALVLMMLAVTACAHAISKETRQKARSDVAFSAVAKNPFFFKGSLFIWGGTIVEATPTETGTTIEVVQTPLDRLGAPRDVDVSEGRFLARIGKLLDPLIYTEGREVTIAGVLVGSEKKLLGKSEYEYPVLDVREIYLWREEPDYYYPYYYPYPYGYPGYWGPTWPRHYYGCDPFWDSWCRYPYYP